ncbi:MAG: toll/interleukin-1 receptor domain-containing protein [Cyanobacteria bacterium P01_H01_bin.15]
MLGNILNRSPYQNKYRYHAFISYAHEDCETVSWLHKLLANYWVPWKGNRRIFFDTQSLGAAGGLNSEIKQALSNSRFLVVCCSPAAAHSRWVNLEIEEFLRIHPTRNVLVCRVGQQGDDTLPTAIATLESQLNDSLIKPDLRGDITKLERLARKQKQEEALALLAPILDFDDKYEVLDRVYRTRQALVALFLGVSTLMSSLYLGWQHWLQTPLGLRDSAIRKLLLSAESEKIDDLKLFPVTEALGKADRKKDLEKFAQIFTDSAEVPFFKSLALATGYSSLPMPNCELAETELKKLDTVTARLYPEIFLKVEKICGGDWMSVARPDPLEPDKMLAWAQALAKVGFINAALAVKSLPKFPDKDVFILEIAIGIASGEAISYSEESVNNWTSTLDDCDSGLRAALDLLDELDRANFLNDSVAEILLDLGLYCASKLAVDRVNYWNKFQELAARLAGAGQLAPALDLLAIGAAGDSDRESDPYFAPGWAWRGLTYSRLGQSEEAAKAFTQAEIAGIAEPPQSRNWSEWDDIVLAYAFANDWKGAFAAAEKPRSDFARLFLRAKLIDAWDAFSR